jgi:hypothetical protein
MDFLDKQIVPPKSWGKFEDLTCALFTAIWEYPGTQKNGRQGQPQNGVDVYGQPKNASHQWYGVQCKRKTSWPVANVTKEEFDAELAKAESFSPPLSHWTLVTTAPNDATLQKHVRKISTARTKAKKFPVEIMFWETVLAKLSAQPSVLQEFYPEHCPPTNNPRALLKTASTSALMAIDDKFRAGSIEVELSRSSLIERAGSILAKHKVLRLTGEGGTGKSAVLRRIVSPLEHQTIVLKDNRTSSNTFKDYLMQLGISEEPQSLIDSLSSNKTCICAIDGADRLLLSERRGLVIDLFQCIALSPNGENWKIVTTARHYQGQDVVAAALREAGISDIGASLEIGPLTDEDVAVLCQSFPDFAPVLRRKDLANQNRSPFLIRELLLRSNNAAANMTELDLAATWANAGSSHRTKSLAELGKMLIEQPAKRPSRAELDPIGTQQLLDEGCLAVEPKCDVIALSYDVHEDWLLARNLSATPDQIRQKLHDVNEPLWWIRAVRLASLTLIDSGNLGAWYRLVLDLQQDDQLDPIWSKTVLSAGLYSERSHDILPLIEPYLLDDHAALLGRLIETLVISETHLNENVMANGKALEMDDAELLRLASLLKVPNYRSWSAFLRWSLPTWCDWPAKLIPPLSEVAEIFSRSTSRVPNRFSQQIAEIAEKWLTEIEDARHWTDWEHRHEPFGWELEDYDGWKKVGSRLRYVLRDCIQSAEKTVSSYLKRITDASHLEEARSALIEYPGSLPKTLPAAWVDMCIAQFVPRKRRYRPGPDSFIRPELFSWHDFHDAGIRNSPRFSISAPTQGGFADLFKVDEAEALRLFHRLEMKASVFWRWYTKCQDQQRPRPLMLQTELGPIPLWGDQTVYKWARGVLGSHVLGSAYLALDDWMSEQAKQGRMVSELIALVLQRNGLVSTAAICIALLKDHVNTKGALDSAGPFLSEPRLWGFDIKAHIDDQNSVHRMGFFMSDEVHNESAEANYQRRKDKRPLSHSLLLPFRLLAGEKAQAAFDARRLSWTAADLADFDQQPTNTEAVAELTERIERCRSDGDPKQLSFEKSPDEQQITVRIEPPEASLPEIEALHKSQALLNMASKLAAWIEKSREAGKLQDGLTIEEAIPLAKQLEVQLSDDVLHDGFGMISKIGPAAVAGTAAILAKFADDTLLAAHSDWIKSRLIAGAYLRRDEDETAWLFDQSILSFDAQVMGAWGLAALGSLKAGDTQVDTAVYELTVQRLHAVTQACLQGLDWNYRPDFIRTVHVLALNSCVIDVGHWWRGESHKLKAAQRTAKRRNQLVKLAQKGHLNGDTLVLPPHPLRWEWRWTGKWPKPLQRLKLRTPVVLDWNRAPVVLKGINWAKLCSNVNSREQFGAYLVALVDWTRAYSEEEQQRHDSHYPYEWAHALAHEIGSFSAAHGLSDLWRSLLCFTDHDRAEGLIGDYLDSVTQELMCSERQPDEQYWNAWKPAAEWVMENGIPKRRTNDENLSNAVRAAGFVGPYTTPIRPNWPWLDDVLPWIDNWVSATCHLPSSISALMPIVERMNLEQRRDWFVDWLGRAVEKNGADVSFWSYAGCGDKAAALLQPLAGMPDVDLASARRSISLIADAGSNVAREVLLQFASKRPV